jgi:HK97 family phage major capsid protein
MARDLKALSEQRAVLLASMDTLMAAAETENRALTEEEQAKFDQLETDIKDLDATVERAKKLQGHYTEKDDKDDDAAKGEKRAEEERAKKQEADARLFAGWLRGAAENRADANLAIGANGAVIPSTIANKIITEVYNIAPILSLSTKYNIKGTLNIPSYSESSGNAVTMAYATEFVDLESKVGSFSSIPLTGYLAGLLVKLSKSLINNSQFDLTSKVIELIATAVARWTEGELLKGTANKIAGLSGVTKATAAASQSALTADELLAVKRSISNAYQAGAVWIMGPETLTGILKLKDANGRYLLEDANMGAGAVYAGVNYTLFGKPVYESDNMPAPAASAIAAYYGDMSGLATKIVEEFELQVLLEKFATQHAIGVVGYTEIDAAVEDAQKIAKLAFAPGSAPAPEE